MIINGEKSIIMDNESFEGLFQNPVSVIIINFDNLNEYFVGNVKNLHEYMQSKYYFTLLVPEQKDVV